MTLKDGSGKFYEELAHQKVLCFDEENNTDWYMQFHIPAKSERVLPTKLSVDEETILVEHARPYAVLQTGSIRPPYL